MQNDFLSFCRPLNFVWWLGIISSVFYIHWFERQRTVTSNDELSPSIHVIHAVHPSRMYQGLVSNILILIIGRCCVSCGVPRYLWGSICPRFLSHHHCTAFLQRYRHWKTTWCTSFGIINFSYMCNDHCEVSADEAGRKNQIFHFRSRNDPNSL